MDNIFATQLYFWIEDTRIPGCIHDDLKGAADELERLTALLHEIDDEIYQSSRGDIRALAQEGFSA